MGVAGVGHCQNRRTHFLHLNRRRFGIRTGGNLQNVRISTAPAPGAAIRGGLGCFQCKVFVAIGLVGIACDSDTCVSLVYHLHSDNLLFRFSKVCGGISSYPDLEAAYSGCSICSRQTDTVKCDTCGRIDQFIDQRSVVGVVGGCPIVDVHCCTILHDRLLGWSNRNNRRYLPDLHRRLGCVSSAKVIVVCRLADQFYRNVNVVLRAGIIIIYLAGHVIINVLFQRFDDIYEGHAADFH